MVVAMMPTRRMSWPVSTLILAATLAACSRSSTDPSSASAAVERLAGSGKAGARAHTAVRTAAAPGDPCGWIPVGEVEAIVGTLAGPPQAADGCLYTLALPDSVKAARERAIADDQRLQEKLKAAFKDYEPPQYGGALANFERDARNYAISLKVNVEGSMAEELGAAAGFGMLASWLPPQPGAPQAAPDPTAPTRAGWDSEIPIPYGFRGRLGHVSIVVAGEAPDVPEEPMRTLAERVRDRIPDLPFPVQNRYQTPMGGGPKSPCSLLTRAEAEAVLGPLVVDPYLASADYPPAAHDDGLACAYFTAGHRALVLEPNWGYGRQTFRIEAAASALMSIVAPADAAVLEGPWDEARVSSGTGALLLLKGDTLLKVHYLMSSTDRRGAVTLAARAMQRLGS